MSVLLGSANSALIGLEILALQKSYKETLRKIREYQHILSNQKNMDVVIKEDLDAISL